MPVVCRTSVVLTRETHRSSFRQLPPDWCYILVALSTSVHLVVTPRYSGETPYNKAGSICFAKTFNGSTCESLLKGESIIIPPVPNLPSMNLLYPLFLLPSMIAHPSSPSSRLVTSSSQVNRWLPSANLSTQMDNDIEPRWQSLQLLAMGASF